MPKAKTKITPIEEDKKRLRGQYTNWRGETRTRTITPLEVRFGSTDWHPEPQWLLKAVDETGKIKEFALKDFNFTKEP